MDRVADIEAGQVDVETLRDVVDAAMHLDRVTHHVEHAAATNAGALFFVDEGARHFDGDLSVGGDTQQVDMLRKLIDRVNLQIAGDHPFRFAVDLQIEDGREESARVDALLDVARIETDQNRVFLVAVDHGRDTAGATCCPGGPLTSPVTRLRRHGLSFCHR